MGSTPSRTTRLRAALRGEVSAQTLEAYRQAGAEAHGLLVDAEERRGQLAAEGGSPWTADPATQAMLACTWCAFVQQRLGDAFLDADYRADPKTVGFVPRVTLEQVLALYEGVEPWLSRARQAQVNAAFRLDVTMPAGLPPWAEVEPCPPEHLVAILAASDEIVRHAETAVDDLRRATDAERGATLGRLDQELAAVKSAGDYARGLFRPGGGAAVHERAEASAKDCIERAYRLGQLAAMPALVDELPAHGGPVGRLPGPGEAGFDPWCLTDPATRERWQRDPRARASIDELWRDDDDVRKTLRVQAQIDDALRQGSIEPATDGRGGHLGNFFRAPWAAIYAVKRPVTIGGRRLATGERFTFDVCGDELVEGGPFERAILVGDFRPTDQIEYEHEAGSH